MMQMEMMKALNSALNSPKLSAEALQVLLNLAEFMEHDVAVMDSLHQEIWHASQYDTLT